VASHLWLGKQAGTGDLMKRLGFSHCLIGLCIGNINNNNMQFYINQIVSLCSTISTSKTNVIKMPAIHFLEEISSHLKGFRRNLKKLTNI
jgi:hypothetical protein